MEDNKMSLPQKTTSNFLWRFFERCGAQAVSFFVSIVLARLLAPEVYGTIALITVFTSILQVFVDSGLGTALVQKKNADDLDFSTVFFFNIGMCLCLYLLLFCAAPWIASFYEMPELEPVVRVLGLTLVISGVRNIQQSYISKHMLFKKFFFSTIGGVVISAAVGIGMAYAGCGVWALVAQNLVNQAVGTVILWFTVQWRPHWTFSLGRLKTLFSYGWKLLASSLLDTGYRQLQPLIIGKKYAETDLAFYNKGSQFPDIIVTNINTSIDSVLFPSMAAQQDHKERVRAMTRRAIRTSSYIMWPLMMGLAVCAEPIVRLLLTETWLPCVPYLRIFCVSYVFYPIHTANLNAIKAMGRSDLFLILEVCKKVIGLLVIGITMWFGVIWLAYSLLIISLISQVINSYPNWKLLDYSYWKQLCDILPSIGLSLAMGAVVYLVSFLGLPDLVTLLIQVPLGAGIYFAGSKLFHFETLTYIENILKNYLHRGKKAAE